MNISLVNVYHYQATGIFGNARVIANDTLISLLFNSKHFHDTIPMKIIREFVVSSQDNANNTNVAGFIKYIMINLETILKVCICYMYVCYHFVIVINTILWIQPLL